VKRPAGAPPVDVDRLRREFALSEDDVQAYTEITRRILGAPPDARANVTREALAGARRARDKAARGEALAAPETLLLRYLAALEKMQRKGAPGGH
jgi:hypothetical protein